MILQRHQIFLLWFCQILFMLRVLGQFLVAFYGVSWLPSMKEWQSGLLPYPMLLSAQIVMIVLMTKISYDNSYKTGVFYISRPKTKTVLKMISVVYASIMILRYVVSMICFPEMRWSGGAIPISFHLILAFYIYLTTQDRVGPL